jgi:choline kinase
MNTTLLIMAAGLGSRYGGNKQIDRIGPNGEILMEYSIHDAIEAGFDKVVFVIRRSMEADFQEYILPRYKSVIPVEYVFQELDMLPEGFSVNPERVKPYGTAHAILVAKDAIKEPFTVINADDFYGKEPFQILADYLTKETANDPSAFAMVGYRLANTL